MLLIIARKSAIGGPTLVGVLEKIRRTSGLTLDQSESIKINLLHGAVSILFGEYLTFNIYSLNLGSQLLLFVMQYVKTS